MKIRNLFTDIRDNISDDKKGLKSAKPTHWGGIDHIGERSVATSRKRPEFKVAAVEWVGGGGREIGGRDHRVCGRAQRIENGGETRESTSEGISRFLYTSGESTGFPAWGGYHLTNFLGKGHLKTEASEDGGDTREYTSEGISGFPSWGGCCLITWLGQRHRKTSGWENF